MIDLSNDCRYTFDTGFPPDVMEAVAKLINVLVHRGGKLKHFAYVQMLSALYIHAGD